MTDQPQRRQRWRRWVVSLLVVLVVGCGLSYLFSRALKAAMVDKYVYSHNDRMDSSEFSQWEVSLLVPALISEHRTLSARQRRMTPAEIMSDLRVFNARINAWGCLQLLRHRDARADEYIRLLCQSGKLFDDETGACDE